MGTALNQKDVQLVSINDVVFMRDKLKKCSSKWATRLAELMFKEEGVEYDPFKARDKVYSIINGGNRDQQLYILFVTKSNDLLAEYSGQVQQAATVVRITKEQTGI